VRVDWSLHSSTMGFDLKTKDCVLVKERVLGDRYFGLFRNVCVVWLVDENSISLLLLIRWSTWISYDFND